MSEMKSSLKGLTPIGRAALAILGGAAFVLGYTGCTLIGM